MKWIAKQQNREPKTRAQLQTYFDPSIAEEARGGKRWRTIRFEWRAQR